MEAVILPNLNLSKEIKKHLRHFIVFFLKGLGEYPVSFATVAVSGHK